jgi:gliding motility-associated lipoprotein GldB
MKNIGFAILLLLFLISCGNDNQLEKDISKIDVNFKIERFDLAFAHATPKDLPKLKETFPFLFSKRVEDSVWVDKMKDTLQLQLAAEVEKKFSNFKTIDNGIESLFQHLKYYDKTFKEPRIITVTSNVDYRNKTIVTDSIVLISLDTYLGTDHKFYEEIPRFMANNMKPSQIVPDLAANYADKYIYPSQRKTLLDEMIYFGKELYFKDKMIPFVSDAEKIGYTQAQLDWSIANESYIWRYFVEKELLFSTDNTLPSRFTAQGPFSKFYLQLDNESPGRIGQYIGWQIVRAYMEHNKVSLMDMLQKDATEIFNNSKFKPRK